jgi:hypothetical protein
LPPLPIQLVGHTRFTHDWSSCSIQEPQGLTGCLDDVMVNANGRATPGLHWQLADHAASGVAFRHAQTLGRIQQVQNFGALKPFTAQWPHWVHSSSLPFCVRFKIRLRKQIPYTHPATLDTGRAANTYPGGILPRSSSNHFQYARASDLLSDDISAGLASAISWCRYDIEFVLTISFFVGFAFKDAK